jgi:hypothetical protein
MKKLIVLFLVLMLFSCNLADKKESNVIYPDQVLIVNETSTNLIYFLIDFTYDNVNYKLDVVRESNEKILEILEQGNFILKINVIRVIEGNCEVKLDMKYSVIKNNYSKFLELILLPTNEQEI